MHHLRLNTLVIASLGILLFVLLAVTGASYFQAKHTNKTLNTVLSVHVPLLKSLLESQRLLNSVKHNFKDFTNTERISHFEILDPTDLLTNTLNRINSILPNSNIQALVGQSLVVARQLATLNEKKTDKVALLEDIFVKTELIRQGLTSFVQTHSQLQQWASMKPFIVIASNLLSKIEYEITRYSHHKETSLNELISPLQVCLVNLYSIQNDNKALIAILKKEDFLKELVLSIEKYRSSISLYYDEDKLEVTGANLEEILNHVRKSENIAIEKFSDIEHSIVSQIDLTNKQITFATKRQQTLFIITSLIAIILVIVISVMLVQVISHRTNLLLEGAKSIGSGNFQKHIFYHYNGDQLSNLAQEFNSMADSLSEREKIIHGQQIKIARSQKMEAIGLMAGGIAHDLNNILSAVVGYPSILLERVDKNSSIYGALNNIKGAGDRAILIVSDLLTIAKGAAIEKEYTQLNNAVSKILESLEFQQIQKRYSHISIKKQLDASCDIIFCSPSHLEKIIMNLVINATEAIAGEGRIEIITQNQTIEKGSLLLTHLNEGKHIILTVKDNGPGISEVDIDHIFEPFYTKKFLGRKGTGLGLTVVWNTVQDHDGYIYVASEHGGTCFKLYFPVRENLKLPKKDRPSSEVIKGDGEHILVVDDEPQLRDLARKMLDSTGYIVKAVSSGEEAIEFLKKNTVDLVLLDMLMDPGINGRQTYEQILQINPNQKVVITSGFSESEDIKVTRQLGSEGFIKKPYTMQELSAIIKDSLTSIKGKGEPVA